MANYNDSTYQFWQNYFTFEAKFKIVADDFLFIFFFKK